MGHDRQPRLWLVGSAAKELCSASWNAREHCPPYTKDRFIAGIPQILDGPSYFCSGNMKMDSNSSFCKFIDFLQP